MLPAIVAIYRCVPNLDPASLVKSPKSAFYIKSQALPTIRFLIDNVFVLRVCDSASHC